MAAGGAGGDGAAVAARITAVPDRGAHVRASWTLRGRRPHVLTPGTNRKVAVLGAVEVTTGAWVYRLGRRRAAGLIALLDQVLRAFPLAPVIVRVPRRIGARGHPATRT